MPYFIFNKHSDIILRYREGWCMMEKQLPPGQFETDKWPILHQGDIPLFDETTWNFRLFGEVKEEKFFTYKEMMELT